MRILTVCLNPAVDISSEADTIYPISKVRTRAQRIEPGGGGVNVARVLSGFGLPSELVYFSGGATGKLLDDELVRYGIHTRCFRIDGPTRVAFTVHQTSNNQEYRFVPEGPVISNDFIGQLMEYLSNVALRPEDIVVASGSLPRGTVETVYADIAKIVSKRQARFILDSSGPGLSATLAGCPVFMIKPSLNELQRLAGTKLDEEEARNFALNLVHEGRAKHVAVSMGSHGAFLASGNGVLRLPAYLVKVHSAVGAGDSFVGGVVYYLSLGHSMEDAFRFGVAAGAAAVMTPGSELCRRQDVEALYSSSAGKNVD